MDLNQRFRQNVRTFYAWIGSMVILGAGPVVAGILIERDTPWWRAVGVVVGVTAFFPWLWLLFSVVRRSDEFFRRIHLIAIAIAAAFGLILLITIGWLVRAWFIEPPDFTVIWVMWMVAWVVALVGTKRYFERPR